MCAVNIHAIIKIPLVSVGIPTYNRPEGLRRTLECITGQTYKNLEIIISDNCSPGPETEEVAKEFISKDRRIQFYRQEENNGPTFNFKFVFEKTTGEYFMWAADDDEWDPSFVNTLLSQLERYSEISVAMCGIRRVDESGYFFDITRFPELIDTKYSRFKFSLFAVSHNEITFYMYGLFRSKCLKKFFQNLDNLFASDLIIINEILLTERFHYVDSILFINRCYLKSGDTAARYPNEEIGKNYGDRFNYLKLFFRFGPYLCRSRNIPLKHKMWIPFLVIRQGIWVSEIYLKRVIIRLFITGKKNSILGPLLLRIRDIVKDRE